MQKVQKFKSSGNSTKVLEIIFDQAKVKNILLGDEYFVYWKFFLEKIYPLKYFVKCKTLQSKQDNMTHE